MTFTCGNCGRVNLYRECYNPECSPRKERKLQPLKRCSTHGTYFGKDCSSCSNEWSRTVGIEFSEQGFIRFPPIHMFLQAGDYLTDVGCRDVFRLHVDIERVLDCYLAILNNHSVHRMNLYIRRELIETVQHSYETVKGERTLIELENAGIPKVLCIIIISLV